MNYTLICNLGPVPERFDRVTKHVTVVERAKCIVTASGVFCFLHRGKQRDTHTVTHVHIHLW